MRKPKKIKKKEKKKKIKKKKKKKKKKNPFFRVSGDVDHIWKKKFGGPNLPPPQRNPFFQKLSREKNTFFYKYPFLGKDPDLR